MQGTRRYKVLIAKSYQWLIVPAIVIIGAAASLVTILIFYNDRVRDAERSKIPPFHVVVNELKPLPGHPVLAIDASKKVYAGGLSLNLHLQASSPEVIADITAVEINVTNYNPSSIPDLNYLLEPAKIPGLGTAEPLVYRVDLRGYEGSAYFITRTGAEQANFPNLLSLQPPKIIRLDQANGPQETLNITIVAASAGLYSVKITTTAVATGVKHHSSTDLVWIYKSE